MSKNNVIRKLYSWNNSKQDRFSEKLAKMFSDDSTEEDVMDRVVMEKIDDSKALLSDLETGDQAIADTSGETITFSDVPSDKIDDASKLNPGDTCYFKINDKVCFGSMLKEDTDTVTCSVDPSCGVDLSAVSLSPMRVFRSADMLASSSTKKFSDMVADEKPTEVPATPAMVADPVVNPAEYADPAVTAPVSTPGTSADEIPMAAEVTPVTEENKAFSTEEETPAEPMEPAMATEETPAEPMEPAMATEEEEDELPTPAINLNNEEDEVDEEGESVKKVFSSVGSKESILTIDRLLTRNK